MGCFTEARQKNGVSIVLPFLQPESAHHFPLSDSSIFRGPALGTGIARRHWQQE